MHTLVKEIVYRWSECANYPRDIKNQKRYELLLELNSSIFLADPIVSPLIIKALCHQVHGAEYRYKLKVTGSVTITDKLCIICPKHGEFIMRIVDHLLPFGTNKYPHGCLSCLRIIDPTIPLRMNTMSFIDKAESIHGDKYDYRKVLYTKTNNKVDIICKRCQLDHNHHVFKQRANSHMNGKGCYRCGRINTGTANGLAFDDVVARAHKIHNDKYHYIELVPQANKEHGPKLRYICNKCKRELVQRTDSHLAGHGCKHCGAIGVPIKDTTIPHRVYLIKIYSTLSSDITYKIGCTKQVLHKRLIGEMLPHITYDVIYDEVFIPGSRAFELEQAVINKFGEYQYHGSVRLRSCSNREMFTEEGGKLILEFLQAQ